MKSVLPFRWRSELDDEIARMNSIRAQGGERASCGTASAYRRHYRDGELPCDACRDAEHDRKHPNTQRRARRT